MSASHGFVFQGGKNVHTCDLFESPFCILSILCTNFNAIWLIDLVLYIRQVCFSTKHHRLIKECVISMRVEITIFAGFYFTQHKSQG